MSDAIPFHIQELFIKRLPVVSLLRFRSVSKAWKSLIDSSNFIAAHSVSQSQHLLIWYEDNEFDTVGKYFSFVDDDTFPQQMFVHTLPHSIKLLENAYIVGSSLGLLCFHGYNLGTEMVVLWNPSIRKSITVPIPNKFNPGLETTLFGVSPVTCDPKIVQITQFHKTSFHCEAKVYTVSSGKWRNLSSNLPSKPFRIDGWPQVVVDRFIYWCAFDLMTRDNGVLSHNVIMSFDMTNDNFGVVDLPDSLRRLSPSQLCISKSWNSIVILDNYGYEERDCGVWMMEIGVEKSFTKRFTVVTPPYMSESIILEFRKNGQPIMEVDEAIVYDGRNKLVVYEPNLECFNCLGFYGKPGTFFVHSYIETLVLIGR